MSGYPASDTDPSTRALKDELRVLRDDELDAADGGLVVIAIIAILIGPFSW